MQLRAPSIPSHGAGGDTGLGLPHLAACLRQPGWATGRGDAAREAQARPDPGSCWPGTGCALVQPALLLLTRCWALLHRSGSALSPSYQGEGARGHRSHSTSVKLPLGCCNPLALTSAVSRGTAGHQQHPPRPRRAPRLQETSAGCGGAVCPATSPHSPLQLRQQMEGNNNLRSG